MKVSELTGEKLAEWTAKAQGWVYQNADKGYCFHNWRCLETGQKEFVACYRPDQDGQQARKVALWGIDKWGNQIMFLTALRFASDSDLDNGIKLDDDMAETICRTVVFLTYGEEVPDDL